MTWNDLWITYSADSDTISRKAKSSIILFHAADDLMFKPSSWRNEKAIFKTIPYRVMLSSGLIPGTCNPQEKYQSSIRCTVLPISNTLPSTGSYPDINNLCPIAFRRINDKIPSIHGPGDTRVVGKDHHMLPNLQR